MTIKWHVPGSVPRGLTDGHLTMIMGVIKALSMASELKVHIQNHPDSSGAEARTEAKTITAFQPGNGEADSLLVS